MILACQLILSQTELSLEEIDGCISGHLAKTAIHRINALLESTTDDGSIRRDEKFPGFHPKKDFPQPGGNVGPANPDGKVEPLGNPAIRAPKREIGNEI